jgi:hypothetical protein
LSPAAKPFRPGDEKSLKGTGEAAALSSASQAHSPPSTRRKKTSSGSRLFAVELKALATNPEGVPEVMHMRTAIRITSMSKNHD